MGQKVGKITWENDKGQQYEKPTTRDYNGTLINYIQVFFFNCWSLDHSVTWSLG